MMTMMMMMLMLMVRRRWTRVARRESALFSPPDSVPVRKVVPYPPSFLPSILVSVSGSSSGIKRLTDGRGRPVCRRHLLPREDFFNDVDNDDEDNCYHESSAV